EEGMRGKDEQQLDVFSYISPEQAGSSGPSATFAAGHDRRSTAAVATSIQPLVRQNWATLDCAGKVVKSPLAASAVLGAQRKNAKPPAPPDDPGNATVDFHGEKRSNQTHESRTDPDAKLARKGRGKEAKLSYNGNLLVENRNGLIVNTEVFEANGTAERDAA